MPHDRHIPEFLVPYNIKTGFQKNHCPSIFALNLNIGTTNIQEEKLSAQLTCKYSGNFYEYQLACKNLDITLKDFTKNAKRE